MRSIKRITAFLLTVILLLSVFPANQARAAESSGTSAGLRADYSEYRNLLTPAGKVIYDSLLDNSKKIRDGKSPIQFTFDRNIGQSQLSVDIFQDAITAFNRDHSEVFWIDFSRMMLTITDMGGYLKGELVPVSESYYTSAYQSAEAVEQDITLMNTRVSEIADAAAKLPSVYERLLYIHDWLVMQNSYNTDPPEAYHMRAFEAVSALEGNRTGSCRPVCEGYSRAFKLLCDALKIPCILVTGEGTSGSITAPHMWNYVRLGDTWYAVDVTWDDPTGLDDQGKISYAYFLVGSDTICGENKTFAEAHQEMGQFSKSAVIADYPVISDTAYSADAAQPAAGMENFTASGSYSKGLFSDVKGGEWFESGVADACRYGLMKGTGDGRFGVKGHVTLAEAITMAARIHAIYLGNAEPVSVGGNWYDAYVAYAFANRMIAGPYDSYTKAATRAEFAQILAAALPAEELASVNDVADGSIPDIDADADYADAAYLLYRAGVLIGNEKGEFSPNAGITRAEVAIIVTRMVRPDARVRTTKEAG